MNVIVEIVLAAAMAAMALIMFVPAAKPGQTLRESTTNFLGMFVVLWVITAAVFTAGYGVRVCVARAMPETALAKAVAPRETPLFVANPVDQLAEVRRQRDEGFKFLGDRITSLYAEREKLLAEIDKLREERDQAREALLKVGQSANRMGADEDRILFPFDAWMRGDLGAVPYAPVNVPVSLGRRQAAFEISNIADQAMVEIWQKQAKALGMDPRAKNQDGVPTGPPPK